MQITAASIQEFVGGVTPQVYKFDANDVGSLNLLVDAIQPNVHLDIQLLNSSDAVVMSRSEKGVEFSEGLFIKIQDEPGAPFAIIGNTTNFITVEGDPATFAPGKLVVRVAGKIDGMTLRANIGENLIGGVKVLQGQLAGNGVYEITIPFTGLQA